MSSNKYSLTTPQKNIYMFEKVNQNTSTCNIVGIFKIHDFFDFEKCNIILNKLLENNDALRIRVFEENGNVYQRFVDYEYEDFECLDFTNSNVDSFLDDFSLIPFNIYNSKLYDFKIVKVNDNSGFCVVKLHHLISDAYTFMQVENQLVSYYNFLINNDAEIDIKSYSYIDFINSEDEYFKSCKYLEKDKLFFDEYLKGYNSDILLKDKINYSLKANRYSVTLDNSEELLNFCKDNKLSPFAFIMAVYAVYIYRTLNINDIVVGSPILNRSNFKEKNTMGMFVSTIPIRININENDKIIDLIKDIGSNTKSAFRHQKYPLNDILKNLNRKSKLFNHMISYQNARASISDNYSSDWIFSKYIQNEFEMHIMDMDNTGLLTINYDYLTDKFDLNEIKFIHRRFLTIINCIINDLDITVDNVDIIDDDEKKLILNNVNPFKVDFGINNVIKLFEENVKKNSDKVAYVFENNTITYGDLNKEANCFARYLKIKHFIRNNDLVPVISNRGFDMIVAILGILKAGGAYVPIDPSFPNDRINFMIEDSNPKIVVNNINKDIDFDYININDVPLNMFVEDNLYNHINDKDLAYMIYTSGTTGKPKGCMIEHRNLFNLVNSVYNYQNLKDINNFVSLSTYSFDIFVLENFIPLSFNKTVVLSNEEEQKMPINMIKLIKDNNIEVISSTPTRIKLLIDYLKDDVLNSVKRIMLGGEVFPKGYYNLIKKVMPNAIIYDGYGPTEITVWSSAKEINDEFNINIGKSLPNYTAYVLDNKNRILPIGVKGELCIGGKGVARGYNNREDLNTKKFISFDNDRIYKTGDLVYLDFDYDLNYVSRMDKQVKLHGLRIELSEIENVIKNIDNVLDCYVMIKNEDKLVAYYSSNEDIDIKGYLKTKLPKYMIPKYFIRVDKFELNYLGKVDKSKLPELNITNKVNTLPQNDIEKVIYDEVCSLLKIDSIDIYEDLFEYGVDSLALIRLVSDLNMKYNINLTEKDVIDNTNICDLSKIISKLINEVEENNYTEEVIKNNEIVEESNIDNNDIQIENINDEEIIENENTEEVVENIISNNNTDDNVSEKIKFNLTNSEKGILKSYFFDTESVMYNIPFEISFCKENVDLNRFKEAIVDTVLNNKLLFSRVDFNDNKFFGILDNNDIKFDLDINYVSLDEYKYFKDKFVKPFDLLNDRLFDIKFFVVCDTVYILFNFNHIIFDGFSFSLLLDEIKRRYDLLDVLDKSINYDSIIESRENIKIDNNAREFYLAKFDGELPDTVIDTDFERTGDKDSDKVSVILDDELSNKVIEFSKRNKVTVSNIFLGMFSLLLSKYTYNEDVVLGMAFNSRSNSYELDSLGMFVKTLPLRFNIDLGYSVKDYFLDIQNNVMDYIKNSSYEYDSLIKDLNISREKFKNPLLNIVYTYQKSNSLNLYVDDNLINVSEINSLEAKFDIVFEVIQSDKFLLNFEFNKNIYLKDNIELLVKYYLNMLSYLDKEYIKDILLTDEKERNYLLNEYNNTFADYFDNKSVNEVFEDIVLKYGDKKAVVFENSYLTYDELNRRSNILARHLRTLGLNRNSVIAIVIDKSLEFAIGVMAVIKAGYSYLPINNDIPDERAKYMMENASAKCILTTKEFNRNILDVVTVDINDNFDYDDKNLNLNIMPYERLYVLYTSGTTGLPKGIEILHKGILRLIVDDFLGYSDNDVMLLTGSITFDTTCYEFFISLLKGMTLHIVKKSNVLNSVYLKNYLYSNNVTTLLMPTPIFNVLISVDYTIFENLRLLCIGGDVLLPKYAKIMKDNLKDVVFINGYGPTENTIMSTCYEVNNINSNIPIGKPIVNSTAYVVDKCNNLCPRNIKGELCVGGDGVARGYINKPDLTSKVFTYFDYIDERIYRTGDLVCLNNDYDINYLGRIDLQLKIRGQRIEILEIQNKILEIDGVKEAFVTCFDSKYLVDFYIADEDIEINDYLKKYLPSYMIPSSNIRIDNLPFNQNSKIDTKVLKQIYLEKNMEEVSVKEDEDLNDTERIILNTFKEVLKVDNLNMDSDFFLNGGDSLMLVEVVSILNINDIKLSFEEVFKCKTPREIYEYILKN